MKRKRLALIGLLLIGLIALWGAGRGMKRTDGSGDDFTITAFSIGKADALLLRQGDTAILVDTGEADDGERLLQEMRSRGIERLGLLLVTHFDKDHVGSAAYLMDQMEIGEILLPDYEGTRTEYEEFRSRLADCPNARRVSEVTQRGYGELRLTVYPAEHPSALAREEEEYDNDLSLVTMAEYGGFRFLLTGDIEKRRIQEMLASDTDWGCDWIKMPHHGGYQKALTDLLDAASPEQAVICCSEKNPAEEKTLELLEERGVSAWLTSEGDVETRCDGKGIAVEYLPGR